MSLEKKRLSALPKRAKKDESANEIDMKNLKDSSRKRLIVILEGAQMETIKVGNTFELLNSDDHASYIRKNDREPGLHRPDIVHQCLLMLFDSPLNRAGLLQVFIHTERNVLIELSPQTRIPRTFKRFAGLMVQLLHKFKIRANEKSIPLMKIIKNPIEDHLPSNCKIYALSYSGKLVNNVRDFVPPQTDDEAVVAVIGAFAHGVLKCNYAKEIVSISNYPLSAAIVCSKLCNGFEESWGIL